MEYALGLSLPRDFARFSVITSRGRPQFVYRPFPSLPRFHR